MDPSLTTHHLAIEAERARLPAQAARGHRVGEAAAMRPRRAGPLAVQRRVGAVLSAVASPRALTVRQLFTHLHAARHSARS